MKTVILTLALTTSLFGIEKFNIEPENCSELLSQGVYNTKQLFDSKSDNDAQYQAGVLTLMLYQACIQNVQFEVMMSELKMIKSRLQLINESNKQSCEYSTTSSASPSFDADMGDYE